MDIVISVSHMCPVILTVTTARHLFSQHSCQAHSVSQVAQDKLLDGDLASDQLTSSDLALKSKYNFPA